MAIEEFQTSLPMMLIRALDHIMPKFRTIFKQFGITEQQARVVRILWQYKKVSFTELSSLTLISPPSLVGIVDRMAENDLVVRTISDIDRRIIIISLTIKGEVLESQIIPKVESVYDEIESSMGTKDLNETLTLLSKLSSIHEQKEIK
tara:strand:- start:173 stop:616 length:444 start_codon:yes stop_codon:yes gene_type:complete